MQITKCDICKKQIKRGDAQVQVAISDKGYDSFEICLKCGELIVKIFKNKKLIKDKKS